VALIERIVFLADGGYSPLAQSLSDSGAPFEKQQLPALMARLRDVISTAQTSANEKISPPTVTIHPPSDGEDIHIVGLPATNQASGVCPEAQGMAMTENEVEDDSAP